MRLATICAFAGLVACGDSTKPAPPVACAEVEILVAASNYESSVVCGAPGCALGPGTTGIDLGQDPQLAASNGRAFFLARDKDTLFELDARCGRPTARISVHEARTDGRGAANPHDVAAAPDGTLFVPLYNVPRLAFVRGGAIDGSLDLSPYDPDGNPQADAIRIVEVAGAPKAFVTLERLDDRDQLRSKQPSQMLRVDVATRTVEAVIDLAGRNPFNPMTELRGALFLAEPGNFDSAEDDLAGIERFDTATSTSKLLVRERDLGGSVSDIAVTDGCGAAIVAGPQPNVNPTALVTFDPETGEALSTAAAPVFGPTQGYDLQGLAWRGRALYVGDRRRGDDGYPVHVFERALDGCALVKVAKSIALPERPVAIRSARQEP